MRSSSRWAAALPEKCKAKDSTEFALRLELVTKFHDTILFGAYDTILAQHFLEIQQNQCFTFYQQRHLSNAVFSTLSDEFSGFVAVFGTALK